MGTNELIAEVIAYNSDAEDSHYDGCYQRHAGCLAVMLRDMLREPAVPDAATEAKQPEGWSTEDRQDSKQEAERRWVDERSGYKSDYSRGCINGFILGAEWQKARETFISFRSIADEALAERDAALAAIERVAALHIESDWKCGNPRHTNPKIGCPECYTECETCDRTYPCDTRAALDGAPEPEWEYGYRSLYSKTLQMEDGARLKEVFTTQRTPDNWLPEMGEIYRRTKSVPAGPWQPVESEGEEA